MPNFYFRAYPSAANRRWAMAGLLASLWLLTGWARAQVPAWTLATTGSANNLDFSSTYALAADASGNLFVAGAFTGTVSFGPTTLTSAGQRDLFVAKYVPATNTWAWAQRGGGTQDDVAYGLAVRGNSVYLTGSLTNTSTNSYQVTLGSGGPTPGPVAVGGASTTFGTDVVVAKYTDQGTTGTLAWVQVAGGKGDDVGSGIAVTSTGVYVTGTITNDAANTWQVVFGGNGTAPGTLPQVGATSVISSDLVVTKYLEDSGTPTVAWTQVAGGTGSDRGNAIAVTGSSVYVTGSMINNRSDSNGVRFGGTPTTPGTLAQAGATTTLSNDLVVAKYLETGGTPTVAWTQVAGGTGSDVGTSLAISGPNVYVTGSLYNDVSNSNSVVFGGAGLTAGLTLQYGATATASADLVVAKYTDTGTSATLGWTQVGGGTSYDAGTGIAASGNNVYVTGWLINNAANSNGVLLGGTGSTVGTVGQPGVSSGLRGATDILVAKYTDNGGAATLGWTQLAGGSIDDRSQAIALSGTSLYVAGAAGPPATFGPLSISSSPGHISHFVAGLGGAVLATAPSAGGGSPRLYPNPAPGPAILRGAPAGAAVLVFDAQGRQVARALVDASGAAQLPGGLAPGLYLVRTGASTVRWAVE
jgi:hypothetical protein